MSMEAMGFDMSTPVKNPRKQITLNGSDDAIRVFTEAVEALDTINIAKRIYNESVDQTRRMLSNMNTFCEQYVPKNSNASRGCEEYIDNCIASLEASVNENIKIQKKNMSGIQWFNGIVRSLGYASSVINPIYKGVKVGNAIGSMFGHSGTGSAIGAGFGISSAATNVALIFAKIGLGTIIANCISCNPVRVGEDILKEPRCIYAINKFKEKHGPERMATVQDLKAYSKSIKTKAGFLNFILTGDVDGKDINITNKQAICIKQINGVLCVVSQLAPFFGSQDLRQLGDLRVLVVTAIYKSRNGNLKSKNIARGYISRGGDMNRSSSSEGFFDYMMDNYAFGIESLGDDYSKDDSSWAIAQMKKIKNNF